MAIAKTVSRTTTHQSSVCIAKRIEYDSAYDFSALGRNNEANESRVLQHRIPSHLALAY